MVNVIKGIVSFTLFGNNPIYTVGALKNIELCAKYYPDFTPRFYLGGSVDQQIRTDLEQAGAELVDMAGKAENQTSTLWRFYVLAEPQWTHMMFRDTDSRPYEREAEAVYDWIESGKDFHIMRDHPEHGMPILAGLWECTQAGAARVSHALNTIPHQMDYYQTDQVWLANYVYPTAKESSVVHDEFFDWEEHRKPFPNPRPPNTFVAAGFNADDSLRIPEDSLRV